MRSECVASRGMHLREWEQLARLEEGATGKAEIVSPLMPWYVDLQGNPSSTTQLLSRLLGQLP